jgi:hypothetical protein
MELYNVIGIVASVDGGRLKRNAGTALLWSAAKFFSFPFSGGTFCGNLAADSSRPLAMEYAEGGALLSREEGDSKWQSSGSPESGNRLRSPIAGHLFDVEMFDCRIRKDI